VSEQGGASSGRPRNRVLVVALAVVLIALVVVTVSAIRDDPSSEPDDAAAPAAPEQTAAPDVVDEGEPLTVLALGDSVAAGVGATSAADEGYVARLVARFAEERRCERTDPSCVQLVDLAVPGATTTSLAAGQLPRALDALLGRNPDVEPRSVGVITITIGGNDVYAPLLRACPAGADSVGCTEAVVERLEVTEDGLEEILTALRGAAGPEAEIAVMTYYNPLPACVRSGLAPLADLVLEGGDGVTRGLNDILREQAEAADAVVVETGPLLGPDDFVGGTDCLHPSTSGHEVIGDAFAEALAAR
jgi:lysophospholipase L1-like esterase